MKTRKIVITGGPGTGKTSIIEALENKGYSCFHEISREIIKEAQQEGISQLFLKDPVLFSHKLLEGRIKQHQEAEKIEKSVVFLDRGVPDIVAYMKYFGNDFPSEFSEACINFKYDMVFILPPWEQIYQEDNERYESYKQATEIHDALVRTYDVQGYRPYEVPCGPVDKRIAFILNHLE